MSWGALKARTTFDWRQAWRDVATLVYGEYSPDDVAEINRQIDELEGHWKHKDVAAWQLGVAVLSNWVTNARSRLGATHS